MSLDSHGLEPSSVVSESKRTAASPDGECGSIKGRTTLSRCSPARGGTTICPIISGDMLGVFRDARNSWSTGSKRSKFVAVGDPKGPTSVYGTYFGFEAPISGLWGPCVHYHAKWAGPHISSKCATEPEQPLLSCHQYQGQPLSKMDTALFLVGILWPY